MHPLLRDAETTLGIKLPALRAAAALTASRQKWGLRYVKLITTRKLTFAATFASLLTPVIFGVEATPEALRDQFALPALARLAQLAPHVGDADRQSLAQLLLGADQIVGLLSDDGFREAVKPITDPQQEKPGSPMRLAIDISEGIQSGLEALFFSQEPLRDRDVALGSLTQRYLSF